MNTFNILAVDPGSNIGITILTIDDTTLEIVKIMTTFVDLKYYEGDTEVNSRLRNKLRHLRKTIYKVNVEYRPIVLAIEDTFVNVRFPRSAILLAQYINVVESTTYNYNKFIKYFKYAPKLIKWGIGAGGNADKDVMMANMKLQKEITKHIDVGKLTEHEIDSLAIGLLTIKRIRENSLTLITSS